MRQTMTGILVALAALAPQAVAAAPKDAECSLRIDVGNTQWRIDNVDVFSDLPAQGSFDVQLINEGGAPCQVKLGVDLQGVPYGLASVRGSRVPYNLSDAGSGNDVTPRNGRTSLGARRTIVIPAHGEALSRFDVSVSPQFETDGQFSQVLFIQASEPGSNALLAERAVTLQAQASPSATIALSGNFTRLGGMADIDLGELTQGLSIDPVVMHIKSTRAYRLRSSSENGGKLSLAGTGWAIPYDLTIDGMAINPATGSYTSSPGNTRRVDNLKLGVIVTGSTDVAAGRYSDIVTLEISVI